MMKEGEYEPCDLPMREKLLYEGYMQKNRKKEADFLKLLETKRQFKEIQKSEQEIIDQKPTL
jgi:hypothetical protein